MPVGSDLRNPVRALLAVTGLAPSEDRAARLLFAAGLIAIALPLLLIPILPFQDLPNTALILLMDRSLGKTANPYFIKPQVTSFGYILSVWVARLLLPWVSVETALRCMCLAGAVALPVATARLAAAMEAPWALAGILALPVGLGWPLRMGFVSFVLAQPVVLMAAAAAVLLCRERSPSRTAELAIWAVMAYLLHAFAFGFSCAVAILAWLCATRRSLRSVAWLLVALVPASILAAIDVVNHALSPVVAETATPEAGITFRPIATALVNIASRAYGISGPATVWFYLPLLVLLAMGIALLAARTAPGGGRWLPLLGTALFTVGAVAFPDSVGNVHLLGPRVNAIGACFAAVAAAFGLSRAGTRALLAGAALSALACAASTSGIVFDSRQVAEVVGHQPPRSLSGLYIPVRAAHCAPEVSYSWGNWDPLRHVWADALSGAGAAPYLFTRHRYAPVWYRVDRILPHPLEGLVVADEDALSAASCARRNRERVEGALTWPGYDGVILMGLPEDAQTALAESDVGDSERLAPGIWKLAPETSRVIVDFGNPVAYRTERSGFGEDERTEGRTVTWSDGPASWLDLDLAALSTSSYRLRLQARALSPALPLTLGIEINGKDVASLTFSTPDWHDDWVEIPPGVLKSGRNRVGFAYSRVLGKRDTSSQEGSGPLLALLFDRLEITR